MANPAANFSRKTRRYATAWQKANTDAVNKAALMTKTTVLAFLTTATGGDRVLSGVGRNGAKLGVSYNTRGFYGNPTALVRATGKAFPLIERDTKTGVRNRRRRSRRSALTAQGPQMGYYHPGTKGKHPFERGVNAAEPYTMGVFRRAHVESLRMTFGGR